jgi:hypothetical protein
MRQRRGARLALGFVFFLAAALVATYPLVLRPSRAIAGGLGDPMLGTVILAWDADRAQHGLQGFWDAPFLFPHRHALAYAEHLIGIALFTTPIEWISGNPVLAYNVAYIGSYVLAGFGMFLLTRALWGREDAAALAGLAFALTPYRLAQSSHLQVLMNGWMPIGLWALHRYFASGSRWWLAAFTAAYAVLGLSNGYYLYFFLLPIAVVAGVEMVRPRLPRGRIVLDLTIAGMAVAAVIAPIARVYYQLQRDLGFTRTPDELPGLSAQLADYFRVASGGWSWGGLLGVGIGERELFHGVVVIGFAAIGACTIGRRNAADAIRGTWTRAVGTYLLLTLLAVWLSMGPGTGRPYGLLFDFVPGFNGLRVPARLSAVVIVALAVLAGAGFAWLLERLTTRTAAVAAMAIAAIIVLEGQHGVGLVDAVNPKDRNWDRVAYEWLRDSPPGAALELNITQQDDFHPFTTRYQFHALTHRHPIVNGYSGWKSVLQELLGAPGSPLREHGQVAETLRGLRAIGVRYVLLHEATFSDPEEAKRMVSEIRSTGDQIAEEHRWPETWAWRLVDIDRRPAPVNRDLRHLDPRTFDVHASHQEGRLPFLFDGDIDTRWLSGDRQDGTEWIDIRFAQPADVGRLRLDTAPRSVVDYPRRLTIESVDGAGATQTLFDGGVVDRLVEALAVDEQHAPIVLDLPRNRTTTLRIRQTGRGAEWWSIHDLNVWERQRNLSRPAGIQRTPTHGEEER